VSICREKRVLVVEDDADIAGLVRLHLEDEGCAVESAGTGQQALRALTHGRFDLVILDRMLPDTDGIEICKQLRSQKDYVPVLMLTARSGEVDRVMGLELGADDYLTKPFSVPELLARVKAILRRAEAMRRAATDGGEEPIRVGNLSVDPGRRHVTVSGLPVELTATEFDLLLLFARHPGRVFTRAQLLEQVWGYEHSGYEHTVNSHINRLRSKLEPQPSEPRYLLTVWGVGYRFFDPGSDQDNIGKGTAHD
jgi:DNA-binding response OmpR family regulator